MHETTGSLGSSYYGPPDIIDQHINSTKEIQLMTHKQKTVTLRFARTMAAAIAGYAAVWLAGPDAAGLITDPTIQSLVMMVVIPTLVAANKALRYGADAGEDSSKS